MPGSSIRQRVPCRPRRALLRVHRRWGHPLVAFLLPSVCFGCGRALGALQRLGACADCWASLTLLSPPLCPGCGLPRPPSTDLVGPARGRCSSCVLRPPAVDAVRAAVAYDETARSFLLRAKLGRRPELLEPLGAQLARLVEVVRFASGCAVVVPVPSHPWVTLRRGFSPARELARPIARRLGLPLSRALRRRPGGRLAAKRLGARQRGELGPGAYRVRGRALRGRSVLLVDDVMTTGATVRACAAALEAAGAARVRAAVWARTPPPGAV